MWVLLQTIPQFEAFITVGIQHLNNMLGSDAWDRSMIIFTHWSGLNNYFLSLSRNAGFLHEPGGFAVLLILSISINLCTKKYIFCAKNLLYILCLLTTFSTAGYLSLFLLLVLFFSINKRFNFVSSTAILFIVVISLLAFERLDFMQYKITHQMETQIDKSLNEHTTGRIYGFRKSVYVATKYPLYGRGLIAASKPTDSSDPEYTGYGWGNFVCRYGLIFGLIFMIIFIYGIKKYIFMNQRKNYLTALIIISANMIGLTSQAYITFPLFFSFFYIGLGVSSNINRKYFYLLKHNYIDKL